MSPLPSYPDTGTLSLYDIYWTDVAQAMPLLIQIVDRNGGDE